jgi:hypothetical protein
MKFIMIIACMMLWGVGVASAQQPAPGGCICGTVPFNPYGCPGSDRVHSIQCTPATPLPPMVSNPGNPPAKTGPAPPPPPPAPTFMLLADHAG